MAGARARWRQGSHRRPRQQHCRRNRNRANAARNPCAVMSLALSGRTPIRPHISAASGVLVMAPFIAGGYHAPFLYPRPHHPRALDLVRTGCPRRAREAAARRASSGRSRTGFACSAARPTSSVTSPQRAATACWRPSGCLARETDGRGWARDTVERLCVDRAGKLLEFCDRDGEREVYLSPRDHRVGVVLAGTVPANEGCVWSFDDGDGPARQVNAACNEEVKAPRSPRPPEASRASISFCSTAPRSGW